MQAEAVIHAAQQAATVLAKQQETVKPDVAVTILQRLGRLRTPEASSKLEVRGCPFHHTNEPEGVIVKTGACHGQLLAV